jgi:hypothetical protein
MAEQKPWKGIVETLGDLRDKGRAAEKSADCNVPVRSAGFIGLALLDAKRRNKFAIGKVCEHVRRLVSTLRSCSGSLSPWYKFVGNLGIAR